MNDLDHIRPHSQIHSPLGGGEILVLETAEEIRTRISRIMKDSENRMGIEMEEAGGGMGLTLTCFEVWPDPQRDGAFLMELYEQTHFTGLASVRSISQFWWEKFLKGHARTPAGAANISVSFVEIPSVMLRPAVPMAASDRNDNLELECCCGHRAGEHALGEGQDFVGTCGGCDCERFHTHPEPDPE